MSANLQPEYLHATPQLAWLPLFAQALVACRLARRTVQAMLTGADQKVALQVCDALEAACKQGDRWCDEHSSLDSLGSIRVWREHEVVLSTLHLTRAAIAAAQNAIASPVDETATYFVQRCIAAVSSDPRISSLQIAILVNSDVDQLTFICQEARIDKLQGVGDYALGRLAPCHALSLIEPPRCIEEEYR